MENGDLGSLLVCFLLALTHNTGWCLIGERIEEVRWIAWHCSHPIPEGKSHMHRYSYRERDYAFGQRILTLRRQIGLTQTGLAELLHLTKRAVGEWAFRGRYLEQEGEKEGERQTDLL